MASGGNGRARPTMALLFVTYINFLSMALTFTPSYQGISNGIVCVWWIWA